LFQYKQAEAAAKCNKMIGFQEKTQQKSTFFGASYLRGQNQK